MLDSHGRVSRTCALSATVLVFSAQVLGLINLFIAILGAPNERVGP